MKQIYIYFISMILLSFSSCGHSDINDTLPSDDTGGITERKQKILYADPTIFYDNGKYYMSGTSQVGNQASRGFTILMSDDLQEWTSGVSDTYRFILGPEWGSVYGTSGFWAPQWYKESGKYYFLYTANEHVAISQASDITGYFCQETVAPIDASEGNIDPYLFKDEDGTYYLYHVRFGGGNFSWVGKYDMEAGRIESTTLTKCMELTEPWERMYNYDTSWIMEGPTVVKWDNVYYLFYSANHYKDPDYAVGYATALSPMGPWTKYSGNPIIRRDIVGEKGSGHGDIFEGKNGRYYYVYHVWGEGDNPDARQVRIVPLIREMGDDGIYKISADIDNIIIPYQVY